MKLLFLLIIFWGCPSCFGDDVKLLREAEDFERNQDYRSLSTTLHPEFLKHFRNCTELTLKSLSSVLEEHSLSLEILMFPELSSRSALSDRDYFIYCRRIKSSPKMFTFPKDYKVFRGTSEGSERRYLVVEYQNNLSYGEEVIESLEALTFVFKDFNGSPKIHGLSYTGDFSKFLLRTAKSKAGKTKGVSNGLSEKRSSE